MSEPNWIPWPHNWRPVPEKTWVLYRMVNDGTVYRHLADDLCWSRNIGVATIEAFQVAPDQSPQLGGPLEIGASYLCRDGNARHIVLLNSSCAYLNDDMCVWARNDEQHTAAIGRVNLFEKRPYDLIARLYLTNPDDPQAPVSPIDTSSKYIRAANIQPGMSVSFVDKIVCTIEEVTTAIRTIGSVQNFKVADVATEAAEKSAWLARAEDKCRRVQRSRGCQCDACKRDGLHDSCCAVHNMPAYPNGPCNCRLVKHRNVPTAFGAPCNHDTVRGHLLGMGRNF